MTTQLLIDHDLKFQTNFVAGCDEAGRGALAGPIVSAGVVFKMSDLNLELLDGVKDSKKVSMVNRLRLYPLIRQAAHDSKIITISNDLIDRNGIQWANLTSLKQCLTELECPTHQTTYLADGFALGDDLKHQRLIKGDSLSIAIAAASILAKVTRDQMMQAFALKYPEYGFEIHAGYGTRMHREAIKKHGPCPIHRTSFKLV